MQRRIGIAFGSGSARGWAHIGVLRALAEAGIRPGCVAGSSIGALVGAAYAMGQLDRLEAWVRALEWTDVLGYLDVRFAAGGLIGGARLFETLRAQMADPAIESLPLAFGAVATDLGSGQEVWLQKGPVLEAVRASLALPVLFSPQAQAGRWLVDGGLVNPVPVSLCRALGAEVVIAVDLNVDRLERQPIDPPNGHAPEPAGENGWRRTARDLKERLFGRADGAPSVTEIALRSLHIMQVRITRSRMAGDPADLVIAPRLAHLPLMDFHRAAEAIEAGRAATRTHADTLGRWAAGGPL